LVRQQLSKIRDLPHARESRFRESSINDIKTISYWTKKTHEGLKIFLLTFTQNPMTMMTRAVGTAIASTQSLISLRISRHRPENGTSGALMKDLTSLLFMTQLRSVVPSDSTGNRHSKSFRMLRLTGMKNIKIPATLIRT